MRQSFGTAIDYTNESKETRGTELEKAYAKFLGCRIVGGLKDGGVDLICDDIPGAPIIQVKSSSEYATKFLGISIKENVFIPIVVGDFGQHTKEEVIESVVTNGGWVGIDIDNQKEMIDRIITARDIIIRKRGGKQKGL